MYRKILAAINEHLNSEVSARYALHLAEASGARLYLCTVAEPGLSEKSLTLASDAGRRLFHKAQELGVDVENIMVSGRPLEEIRKIVHAEMIDVVFAATRHEDIKKRFYEGTVARSLSLSLPCSVALVRVVNMGRIHPNNILVPLKARIDHVYERSYFAAMLANSFDSPVHIFHTTKPLTKLFHGEIHLTPSEWEEKVPGDISLFTDHLNKYCVAHKKKLTPGRIGRTITVEAAFRRHDLIIMGASERGVIRSLIKGNPVEEVLRETPCDLIILKPRHEDT